jgi:hypothetical protein
MFPLDVIFTATVIASLPPALTEMLSTMAAVAILFL